MEDEKVDSEVTGTDPTLATVSSETVTGTDPVEETPAASVEETA